MANKSYIYNKSPQSINQNHSDGPNVIEYITLENNISAEHNNNINNQQYVYTVVPNSSTATGSKDNVLDPMILSAITSTVEAAIQNALPNAVAQLIQSTVADAINTSMGRIVEEVRSLRREVAELRNNPTTEGTTPSIMPKEPLQTVEDVMNLEAILQGESEYLQFKKELRIQNKYTGSKYVRAVWRAIVSDKCAENFSWTGTAEKRGVRLLKISLAIRDIFINKIGGNEEDFVSGTKTIFQFAKNRQKQKEKKSNAG